MKRESELSELENKIKERLGNKWSELSKLAEVMPGEYENRRRAFILLYAHLLRLPLSSSSLRKGKHMMASCAVRMLTIHPDQAALLLQTPTLLNSMLNISVTRNWLLPTLSVMRLYAYLAQALPPGQDHLRLAQLPGITADESADLSPRVNAFEDLITSFEKRGDGRVTEIKKAVQKWGKVEIVDAAFKVFGERYITPSAFISFVVKLRLNPPTGEKLAIEPDTVAERRADESREQEFLAAKGDAEVLPKNDLGNGWAHAPFWPIVSLHTSLPETIWFICIWQNRKPGWWVVLSDVRTNKLVVPPMKVTDIPVGQDYRLYKLQFQGPPQTGSFHWRVHVVSDTFVGEEVSRDIMVCIIPKLAWLLTTTDEWSVTVEDR